MMAKSNGKGVNASELLVASGTEHAPWTGKMVSVATVDVIVESYRNEQGSMVETDLQVQKAVDEVRVAIDKSAQTLKEALKGNAKTNPIRAEVAALFGLVFGALGESAIRNYGTSFFLALELNRPFKRSDWKDNRTLRDAADAKKGKTPKARKSGGVTRTSWEAAGKTLAKLIEQLDLLKAGAQMMKSATALKAKVDAKTADSESK
jgi:hypothetical protein